MANPTTNFGWVMPTATDLVTDLPADFAVFGQGVDTSLADLNGGTTGQILSKTSGTNMDFTWINNDQGDITAVTVTSPITGGGNSGSVNIAIDDATTSVKGAVQLSDSTSTTSSVLAATPTAVKSAYDLANGAIAKSTVTTAGDLIYRNATVPTRLGIGTAGQVLAVNSGATAPEWVTAGGASGLTLISTVTMSAVSTQNFEGVFSSTYTNYKVIMNLASSVDGAVPQLQYLYSTNTVQSGGYYGGLCGFNYSGTANSDNVANTYSQTAYSLPATPVTGGNLTTDFDMTFFKPNTSDSKANFNCAAKSGYLGWLYYGGGAQNTTRVYTGFKIAPNSGTITGTVSIYGLAK